jgi:riboflavin synthase alpha subunit
MQSATGTARRRRVSRASCWRWFEVSLIPTTRELTTLGSAPVGTQVNLEVDVIAEYVERLLTAK